MCDYFITENSDPLILLKKYYWFDCYVFRCTKLFQA